MQKVRQLKDLAQAHVQALAQMVLARLDFSAEEIVRIEEILMRAE